MRVAAIPDLRQVKFAYTKKNMEKAGKGPFLILMNHSSFLDLEIASKIFFPKRYHIVCTSWLCRKRRTDARSRLYSHAEIRLGYHSDHGHETRASE